MASRQTIYVLAAPFVIDGDAFALKVRATFNREWLNDFKRKVKPDDRRWHEATNCWFVMQRHFSEICDLATEYFDVAEVVEGEMIINLKTQSVFEQGSLF
jgi:hypothetical protein